MKFSKKKNVSRESNPYSHCNNLIGGTKFMPNLARD